jgi:hypothetical protein
MGIRIGHHTPASRSRQQRGDDLAWQPIHRQWLDAIAADIRIDPDADLPGFVDSRISHAASDLVETLCTRPLAAPASLQRFGAAMGADGWHLERVSSWVTDLAGRMGRHQRKLLAAFTAGAALAEGWATEYVRGAQASRCIDPVTGLATSAVLRVRLQEVQRQAASLGTATSELYTLVVVEVSPDELSPFERDASYVLLAEKVTQIFCGGETLARHGRRILVLAPNTEHTAERVTRLDEHVRTHLHTQHIPAFVWAETLPDHLDDVDSFVKDLTFSC